MKCFALPPGAVAVSIVEAVEPVPQSGAGPRDLGLSLRARTPDSVFTKVPPRRVGQHNRQEGGRPQPGISLQILNARVGSRPGSLRAAKSVEQAFFGLLDGSPNREAICAPITLRETAEPSRWVSVWSPTQWLEGMRRRGKSDRVEPCLVGLAWRPVAGG
jgi:hypothetical protein